MENLIMQKNPQRFYSENIYNNYEKNVRHSSTYSNSFKNLINIYDRV